MSECTGTTKLTALLESIDHFVHAVHMYTTHEHIILCRRPLLLWVVQMCGDH